MKNLHVSLQVLLNAKEAESEYEKAVGNVAKGIAGSYRAYAKLVYVKE